MAYRRNEFFPAYRSPSSASRSLAEIVRAAGVTMPKASSSSSPSPLAKLLIEQAMAGTATPNEKAIAKNTGILATLGKSAGKVGGTFLNDVFSALDVGRAAVSMGMRGAANEAIMGIVNPILDSPGVPGDPIKIYDINGDKVRNDADLIGLARLAQGDKFDQNLHWAGGTPGGGGLAGLRKNVGALLEAGKTPSVFAGTGFVDVKKGDSMPTRIGKGAFRFVSDAAYDPLTYVTFGTGALGKKAATTAAQASGERIASSLAESELRNIAAKSPRLIPKLVESGKVAADAGADDVAKAAAEMSADEVRRFAADEIGGQAAAAYRQRQSVGVRRFLGDLGEQAGKDSAWALDTFKSLPDEVRGGIRFSTPTGRTAGPRLTQGGGLMFEGKGALGDLATRSIERVAGARTALGGSKLGSKLVLGADRVELGLAKQAAKEAARGVDGAAEKSLLAEVRLATKQAEREAQRRFSHTLGVKTAEWAASVSASRAKFKERAAAWEKALNTATAHLTDANDIAPEGMVALNAIDGATPDMVDEAVRAAKSQAFLTDLDRRARAAYGDAYTTAGDIEGARRVLTPEGRRYIENLKGVATDEFNAERDAWRIVDENGDPAGWWTIAEINKQMKDRHGVEQFFETDPRKIVEKSAAGVRRRVGRAATQRTLEQAGLMVSGVAADRSLRPEPVIASAQQLLGQAGKTEEALGRRIANLAGPAGQGTLFDAPTAEQLQLQAALSEALGRRKNLEALIGDIAGKSGDDQAQAVENLFSAVVEMRQADLTKLITEYGSEHDRVTAARAAIEALEKGSGGGTKSPLEGMVRIGTEASGLRKGRSLAANFDNKFASPAIAEALTRAHSLRNPTEASRFLQLHDEVLTTWRRLATLGRGPQFTARNVSGGMWNGFLAGTGAKHWRQGAEYSTALHNAAKATQAAFEAGTVPADQVGRVLESEIIKALDGKSFAGVPLYELHKHMLEQGTLPGVTASVIGQDLSAFEPANFVKRRAASISSRDVETMGTAGRNVLRAADIVAGDNPYIRWMANLNENAETFLRASTFFAGVEKYGTDRTGARLADLLVKASQFDYADLSPFEQQWLSRVFPFFIWTKNNVPFQLRAIANQPGKINMAMRAFADTEQALAGDTGNDPYLPDYVQQNMGFTSRIKVGGVPLALGMNLPLADVNRFVPSVSQLEQGDVKGAAMSMLGAGQDNVLGATNPLIKQAVEAATGTSTYTGNKYTDTAPGPVVGGLARVPLVGSTLFGAHRDPKTGELVVSGYAQNVLRNFLPPVAAVERLSPIGQTESGQDRVAMNWFNSTIGSASPITPQAAVNDKLIEAGQLREIDRLDTAAKRAAGNAGVDPKWIADKLDAGYSPLQIRSLIKAGEGRTGASDRDAASRWLMNAMRGGLTPSELAELRKRQSGGK